MSLICRPATRAWVFLAVCAAGFLVWADGQRAKHVAYASSVDREGAQFDGTSPTGYAGGKRWLIVPEHNSRTYQWIAETQQMLARGEWRIRRVDYENAPFGREVDSPSPYRWWLGLIAWGDHVVSGRPLGAAVEQAALWADPLLHLLILGATLVFVGRKFGVVPGALAAMGWATLFPLAATFLPGVVGFHGLAAACAFASVLPLLAGTFDAGPSSPRWFFLGGVAGGFGLWISATSQAPIVAGVALGGVLAAWVARRDAGARDVDARPPLRWRLWALGGAISCLLAYLAEYCPGFMSLRLQANHPLYGLAWLGVGELLAQIEAWIRRDRVTWSLRRGGALVLAFGAVAALPVAMATTTVHGFLGGDAQAFRFTDLPNGVVAPSLRAWIARDGITAAVGAAFLPLVLLGPAVWLFERRQTGAGARTALALALGPVLIALGFAVYQLRWWSMVDGALLALTVATAVPLGAEVNSGCGRWLWFGCLAVACGAGLVQLWPPVGAERRDEFTKLEVEELIERPLAHWIADHAGPGGAVVLAPPDRTVSLCFYGGLRGLGTPNWENSDGLAATVQIVSATTAEEAQALLNQRNVTCIILPSWDSDFDDFVRWTLRRREDSFLDALEHWKLPPWIRPLPYQLPIVAGFDGQSLQVFQVTDESNRAVALSRLAEYFVEMRQLDLAMAAGVMLQRFPANLGALVALAGVEKTRADTESFDKDFAEIVSMVSGGLDRTLPWDRRVSLAVMLAEGGRTDLAREQVKRCLGQIDDTRVRSLTTASLYRLLVLEKTFGLGMPDERTYKLALQLLPTELRSRL